MIWNPVARSKERQDRAKCQDCDWSFGWDLRFEMVKRYAAEHHDQTDHKIDYRVQFITHQEYAFTIGES